MALMQPYPTSSSKGASQIPQPYQPPSVHPSRPPQARPPQLTPAFQVIPSRTYDPDRTEATLEAAMQSLVLDARRPVALEIAADGTGARSFLVRATDGAALEHAKAQLRAYAPQVLIRSLEHFDPLTLLPSETVSVCELRPGAASYLPLRTMERTDPLRGLLGSLTVPADMRAIAQLALIPAVPRWSQQNLRKAVEHPLEQERTKHRDALVLARDGIPSTIGIIFLSIIFTVLMLSFFLSNHLHTVLPPWVLPAITDLFLRGSLPQLSRTQSLLLYGGAALLLGGSLILSFAITLVRKRFFAPPLYDQQMVAHKTSQMAYRARLRLYAFGPHRPLRRVLRRYVLLSLWSTGRWLWSRIRHHPKKHAKKRIGKILRRGWQMGLRQWQLQRQSRQRRKEILQGLIAAYRQFDTASANYFVPTYQTDRAARQLVQNTWWRDVASSRHYITSDFLSRAWYLPQASMFELPGIEQKRSRTLLLPTALIAPPGRLVIGVSVHAGYTFPFAFPPDFLTQHTLIGGKSGEGKSTLMTHIAQAAMENMAVCLLDPHGDLASDVLCCVPQRRQDDVVFIDLGDSDFCVGFNPLDVTLGRNRDLTVASLVETFRHLWESGWGPRMEAPFRAALMTLYEANEALVQRGQANQQYTLLDISHLLLDESFCHDVLVDVQDIYLHRFWFEYFDPLDMRQQRERIDPVLTKMLQFEAQIARRILGQSCSTINLSQLIAERKIIVIRLATGEAGLSAPLLGATVLGLLMVALREQSTRPPEERVRMSIIVDEFQSIPGADYALLLAELRKFGGSAVLATQSFEYLEKLSPHLLPTTLANVKQFFMFRLSAEDARIICRELGDVTEEDMTNLDTHACYVKLTHGKQQQPTFSLELERPTLQDRSQIEAIRTFSRRYTRQASEVEKELFLAMARALQATTHHQAREGSSTPFTQPHHEKSRQKGNTMRHKTQKSPIVDGTVVTPSPSPASTPAKTNTTAGEQEETTQEAISSLRSRKGTSQEQQRSSTEQRPQAESARRVRFSKRTERQKQDSQASDDNIISSFDLHPLEDEREDKQEHEQ